MNDTVKTETVLSCDEEDHRPHLLPCQTRCVKLSISSRSEKELPRPDFAGGKNENCGPGSVSEIQRGIGARKRAKKKEKIGPDIQSDIRANCLSYRHDIF